MCNLIDFVNKWCKFIYELHLNPCFQTLKKIMPFVANQTNLEAKPPSDNPL